MLYIVGQDFITQTACTDLTKSADKADVQLQPGDLLAKSESLRKERADTPAIAVARHWEFAAAWSFLSSFVRVARMVDWTEEDEGRDHNQMASY